MSSHEEFPEDLSGLTDEQLAALVAANPGFAMTVDQAAQSSELARAHNEAHPDNELPTLMGATIHLDRVNLEDIPRPEER